MEQDGSTEQTTIKGLGGHGLLAEGSRGHYIIRVPYLYESSESAGARPARMCGHTSDTEDTSL